MERRRFLRLGAAGLSLPALGGLRHMQAFGQTPSPASPFARYFTDAESDHVLVIVRMFGGNDGLNTVVPYTDDNYYQARMRDSAVDLSLKPEEILKLPGSDLYGLHPSLAPMLPLWEEGKVAIVQNVGYPNQDLSHFRSNDIWLSASDASVLDESGWLGRYLEHRYPEYPDVLPEDPYALEVGTVIGRSLLGHHETMGFTLAETSYVPDDPGKMPAQIYAAAAEEEAYIRESMRQSNVFLGSIVRAFERSPENAVEYGDRKLSKDLAAVARLITGGLKTQLYIVNTALYDFHATQLRDQAYLFDELGPAIASFQRDLEAGGASKRVTLMTISEFGRRLTPGGSGTDHGEASMLFVVGENVNGGVIGNPPNLSDLSGNGNVRMEFDFRQVYASALRDWLSAGDAEVEASLYRSFETLPIFRTVPSGISGRVSSGGISVGMAFPNPVADVAVIPIEGEIRESSLLRLVSMEGRIVRQIPIEPGSRAVRLEVGDLPSGTYMYSVCFRSECSPAQGLTVVR